MESRDFVFVVLVQQSSRETEASAAEDFVDFKRFIWNELAELKAKYDNDIENFDSTEHCFKDHPFCRIIFNNLQARIESLEKQRQDQQKILEMPLARISFESGVRSQEDEQNVKTRLKEELVNKSKQNCKEKKDTILKIEKPRNNKKKTIVIENISDNEIACSGKQKTTNKSNQAKTKQQHEESKGSTERNTDEKATKRRKSLKVLLVGDSNLPNISGEKLTNDYRDVEIRF